ncbi:MAG: PSD1 and planctomycete cytochrome C domain-containing protein [Planctomycetota bacterium]
MPPYELRRCHALTFNQQMGWVRFVLGFAAALIAMGITASGQEAKPAEKFTAQQLEFFETKVRPILADHCYECHGPEASPVEGGLSLASRPSILEGGDTGPAIVPKQADKSLLIETVNYDGVYEMPPDTKLSDEKIKILVDWVNDGAPWPESDQPVAGPKKAFDLKGRKNAHWVWKPIARRKPPAVNSDWPTDPIDQFVFEKIDAAGLKPAPAADRRTLIRRAYFDLIGLPPTPEQVDAFVNDSDENAFEKVVDELLDSPHFGERWARHWMDLVRYAETYGHEFDYPIPYPHQYRDYLIRAFNEDVSYKQMIEEHIAGDLVSNPRRHPKLDYNESVLGTGFWFFNEAKHGAVDSLGEEAATFDNQIDVMSKTFLGMTVACARCHDHKFDAISTADYYALYGFLKSSRRERLMLDPGRKIEQAHEQSLKRLTAADRLAANLYQKLDDVDVDKLKNYFDAAVQLAPGRLPASLGITLEAEALQSSEVESGVREVQTIKKTGKFKWRGDQQNWWRDGKVGETWALDFEIPELDTGAKATSYRLSGIFTIAGDYGRAKILIDDKVASQRADFYNKSLAVKQLELGEFELAPGKHQIKFVLLKANKKAIQRNMIGIDALQIQPVNGSGEAANDDQRSKLAAQKDLDPEILERLVSEVVSAPAKSVAHPLYQLRQVIEAAQAKRQWGSKDQTRITQATKTWSAKRDAFFENSTLLEDFNDPLPNGWSSSGFAFGTPTETTVASTADSMLQPAGTISSGRTGKPFYGVLRSPSFTIENNHIHFRLRGRNVTVRLIIDSFFMDEYNGLLYRDCKKSIPNSNDFVWFTQSGDIKNYIGRRGYLEIIDHGEGFVELDEIRFSNGAAAPGPTPFNESAKEAGVSPTAKQFATLLTNVPNAADQDAIKKAGLVDWLVKNKLVGMVSRSSTDDSNSDVSAALNSNQVALSQPAANANQLAGQFEQLHSSAVELLRDVPAPMMALGMADGNGEEERVFIRGNHKTLGPIVERRFLSALSAKPLNPIDSSGRLQLARKITAANNPLTSRVAANRLWHHVMGRGIVASVDNFGVLGKSPTHPELLDYLAKEFQSDGWSVKRMVRRLVLTNTYQMSSNLNPDALEVDPDNLLLHRANIKRLPGEAIRDSLLQISGRLDRTMYGPSVPIHLTAFMSGRGRPRRSGPIDGAGRRSLYLEVRRNFLSPMMLAFDTPIPFNTIGARNQSNVPSQALILMNSPLVASQAELWAKQLVSSERTTPQRIELAFQTAFARPPSEAETKDAIAFLKLQLVELNIDKSELSTNVQVWKDFCHVLFNVKEFIYIQ